MPFLPPNQQRQSTEGTAKFTWKMAVKTVAHYDVSSENWQLDATSG